MCSRGNCCQISFLTIHIASATATTTGTSVRHIDTGNQHDNNTPKLHYVYLFWNGIIHVAVSWIGKIDEFEPIKLV